MKKILPAAAMLTMVGALASCTSTPAPVSTPAPTTTPVTETPAVTTTETASTGSVDAVMTGSTSTGVDVMTGTVSTGATSTGSTPAVPDMTMTGTVAPTTATPAPVSSAVVHTKTVTYSTPAGKDDVEFSVTTANGKITAVAVTAKATNDVSKMLQGKFKDAIATEVVGKEISKLNLKAVGGASLTTAAFTQYVNSL
ncbi:MAG: hypothetical protein ACOYN2_03445 [Patescibacteria group bacterium]